MESGRVILDIHHFSVLELTLRGYLLDVERRARWVAIYWMSNVEHKICNT